MAQITKSIQDWQPMVANLIPLATVAKISQDDLLDRLAFRADLEAKAELAASPVLASCYHSIAKAALTAEPREDVERQTRGYRAKAALLGPQMGDHLLRMADDLERRNPAAPRRATVRKAQAEPSLVPVYDCNGKITGVVDEAEIIPVTDPEVVAKAASVGMAAVYDDRGKPTGFVHPDAVSPAEIGTVRGPVNLGGTTGLGMPRNSPQQRLPGDGPGRTVIKAAGRAARRPGSRGGRARAGSRTAASRRVHPGRPAVGYVRPQYIENAADARFPAGTPDAERPSAGPDRINVTERQVSKTARRPVR